MITRRVLLIILILLTFAGRVESQQGNFPPSSGGITLVSSLPATCTPGTTAPVQLNVAPFQIYDCTATNTWTPDSTADQGVQNVKNYGAIGDAQLIADAVLNSTTLLTSASARWSCPGGSFPCSTAGAGSDVGKIILCANPGSATVPLPVGDTIASIQSATNITLSAAATATVSNVHCTWATQDETTAVLAAVTAATGNVNSRGPNNAPTLQPTAGTVFFPPGGYILSNRIENQTFANNSICPSFRGAGYIGKSQIYLSPRMSANADGKGALIELAGCANFIIQDLGIDGLLYPNATYQAGQALIRFQSTGNFKVDGLSLQNYGSNAGSSGGAITFSSTNGQSTIDRLYIQNSPGTSTNCAVLVNAATGIHFRSFTFSNNNCNLLVNANAPNRTSTTQQITFEQGFIDECGAGAATVCTRLVNGQANFIGVSFFGAGTPSTNPVINIDGTSIGYFTDINCGAFNSANNFACMNIASGGAAYVSSSTLRGNGTSAAVTGVAGSFFYDLGGNIFQNWNGTTCNATSPADPTGCASGIALTLAQGYSGGIVPHASVTHTPNTCYVTGTFGATTAAAPMCVSFMDQNYQVLHVTAASTTATACTVAPVVTLTDGAATATLTITTAKSIWDSAVDTSSGINVMFLKGNQLTVSNTAGTCTTPPTNFSVTMTLQSILNP